MTEQEAIKEMMDASVMVLSNEKKFSSSMRVAMKALKDVQRYREIGTLEECRVATEKQKPKKPSESRCTEKTHYRCPNCGFIPFTIYKNGRSIGNKPAFCERCGQEIDWSDINAKLV